MKQAKKKILYLTATDWFWPKQRPQFLAEGLAPFFEVTYVYSKTYRGNTVYRHGESGVERPEIVPLFRFPLNRFSPIRFINRFLTVLQVNSRLKTSDIIWFSDPSMFEITCSFIPEGKMIIYDCIDDHAEFSLIKNNRQRLKKLITAEGKLISKADHVFASSAYLKHKLETRYGDDKNVIVLNNAISPAIFDYDINAMDHLFNNGNRSSSIKLIYTGTISDWFDFDLLKHSLDQFQNIEYLLIGPVECKVPRHKRLTYVGPVPHKNILSALIHSDALVMPFKSIELVNSVNPVKIYEYIFSGKPSIIPSYPETENFSDFVYLYRSEQEYFEIIQRLINNQLTLKAEKDTIIRFIEQNTWEQRCLLIMDHINRSYENLCIV